ncbi:MAG: 50S ribosome-binding GTPase [Ignavibacteriaceae bacterium]|nr:50S ribosome-binding GTPase [Ignavibacteriaceae bacterium]
MSDINGCESCPAYKPGNLIKQGINMSEFDFVVALAGNPNTGKSTVFNNLTGLRQHTGNWPGKTVSRAEGAFSFSGKKFKIVDLPGTYSLLSTSQDEEIARDFILFGKPDVTIVVVDATMLERNLNLVLQVLEITEKAVLCVNLIDEAERKNITIDGRSLSRELGIPVILAAARQNRGMPELLNAIFEVASGKYKCKPHRISSETYELKRAVEKLTGKVLKQYPQLPNARWVALRLLDGDQRMIDAIKNGELNELYHPVSQEQNQVIET